MSKPTLKSLQKMRKNLEEEYGLMGYLCADILISFTLDYPLTTITEDSNYSMTQQASRNTNSRNYPCSSSCT